MVRLGAGEGEVIARLRGGGLLGDEVQRPGSAVPEAVAQLGEQALVELRQARSGRLRAAGELPDERSFLAVPARGGDDVDAPPPIAAPVDPPGGDPPALFVSPAPGLPARPPPHPPP